MELSARHVGELAGELAPLVVGARVVEVQPHPPRDLLLILAGARASGADEAEGAGGEPERERVRRLRLSADPRGPRVHLQIERVRRRGGPPGPFFRRANELLSGLRLAALETEPGDRALRLRFEAPAEATPGEPRAFLVAELFGHHANLVLLDGSARVLARLVEPKPGSRAAERLAIGAAYHGAISRDRARPAARPDPALRDALPDPPAGGTLARLAPLSWRVEAALGRPAEERWAASGRRELVGRIDRRLKSARRHVEGLEERARACADAERVRMDAELLLAHLPALKRGMREVVLPDAHRADDPAATRRIALDPGLSPRRNAERLFRRYKKLSRTREKLPEELEAARAQVERLTELRERAAAPDAGPDDSATLEAEALAAGLLRERQDAPKRRRPEPRRPYRRFTGVHGAEIRVGRNARDNDELTFRHARGNDLWLHAAGAAGSHVVVRLERADGKREPDDEDVLDAAHLALHFSPLRDARRGEVHVARRKDVRKPKGAPPGLVSVAGGRVRTIRVEPGRLRRLLDTRPGGSPETGGQAAGDA